MNHVEGREKGEVKLFALSTCVWCKKTKALLKELGVGYDYVDVDMLDSTEKAKALAEIHDWNPSCSFPTLVIGNQKCIAGFDEARIREELG